MLLNEALFRLNKSAGFVLKPDLLRNSFDLNDKSTWSESKVLNMTILSGSFLQRGSEKVDPKVQVTYHWPKSPEPTVMYKTKTIKNDGFPTWNESFDFTMELPELSFIRFRVVDDDVGKDDLGEVILITTVYTEV